MENQNNNNHLSDYLDFKSPHLTECCWIFDLDTGVKLIGLLDVVASIMYFAYILNFNEYFMIYALVAGLVYIPRSFFFL
jgi:hypothetical protein